MEGVAKFGSEHVDLGRLVKGNGTSLNMHARVLSVALLALSALTAQPALAFEELLISYAGPSITFLPAEVARQRGFFREQNLDVKLLLTRTEVDRAALASGNIYYTLRAGSTFVSAARTSRASSK